MLTRSELDLVATRDAEARAGHDRRAAVRAELGRRRRWLDVICVRVMQEGRE